jgi:hypothetical protein
MQTSVFITPNSLLVECIIAPSGGTTQQKNPFGTQMELQNRKIIAIEAFSNQDMINSPISSGNAVIPPYVFKGSVLTLYTSSIFDGVTKKLIRPEGLYYDQMPLSVLRRVHNYSANDMSVTSGGSDVFRIRPTEIAWTKSYVSIPVAIGIGQTYSALFLVHYLDEGDTGTNYM